MNTTTPYQTYLARERARRTAEQDYVDRTRRTTARRARSRKYLAEFARVRGL